MSHMSKKTVVRRTFSEEKVDNLKACLDTTDWGVLLKDQPGAEDKTNMFTDYLNFCTDALVPTKTVTIKPNSKPWVDKKVISMIQEKSKCYKSDQKRYNLLKNRISRQIGRNKRQYIRTVQENIANDPRHAWQDIKKIGGIPSKNDKKNDRPITLKPDALNEFYARFEKAAPHIPTNPVGTSNGSCMFDEITPLTVCKQLKKLDQKKSAGPDGILPSVLKRCADQLSDIICYLYNLLIREGTTPKIWKTAKIKPIPKIPRPLVNKDYRPIAITSHLCKVLERIIKRYIVDISDLDPLQFAYQASKSTQDAAMCLLTNITRHIDKKNTNYVRALFLDFSSAFNTIDVNILISKMNHLDENIVRWVQSFLTNRLSYTETGPDNKSAMITTNTGMPQGTVLSPVLFILYTDSIRSTSATSMIIKYADDTVLLGFISDHVADNDSYFEQVDFLTTLCAESDLLLNSMKTHEMIFTTKREKPDVPILTIDGNAISISDEVKYLGLTIDSNLRFDKQADFVISKAKQRMYVLRKFYALGAESKLITQLYKSFIESKILHCIILYFDHLYSNQKAEMRDILLASKRYGVSIDYTLDSLISDRAKNYVLNIFHNESHFVHDILDKLPSGRLRTHKVRANIGRVSFYTKMIKIINDNIF